MLAVGKDASTIRNTITPIRVLYRQAVDDIPVNPTAGLQLPKPEGRRDRIATPEEGALLIAALQERDRGLWSTAMYAGLRRGELLDLENKCGPSAGQSGGPQGSFSDFGRRLNVYTPEGKSPHDWGFWPH
jgi:integrase